MQLPKELEMVCPGAQASTTENLHCLSSLPTVLQVPRILPIRVEIPTKEPHGSMTLKKSKQSNHTTLRIKGEE